MLVVRLRTAARTQWSRCHTMCPSSRDSKQISEKLQWVSYFPDLLSVMLRGTELRNFSCCLWDKCNTGAMFHEIYGMQCVGEIHIFAYHHAQTYVRLNCRGNLRGLDWKRPQCVRGVTVWRKWRWHRCKLVTRIVLHPATWWNLSWLNIIFQISRLCNQLFQTEISMIF